MRTAVSGYQVIEGLYESSNSLVQRARREVDNQPVILKILKQTHPSPEKIAWFKREYEIIRRLNPSSPSARETLPGVIQAYGLENDQHRWAMILEDFGGESLTRLGLAGNFTLVEFLRLAIKLADIVGQVHQKYIMHKDINPANIVFNPTSKQVKLIDFGIATILSRETTTLRNPNVLEGTLAYISPEQTGRMNRAMDYRTDFYSMGVTFYELLTGQLPFEVVDALELVHNHIAKQPPPPHQLRPDIPPVLSEIVLKLLAKNAEDRYQSAYGLKADLEECLAQWQTINTINNFSVGRHDVSLGRFQIPEKLYGREPEIKTLLAAFERVAAPISVDSENTEENSPSKIENLEDPRTGAKSKIEMMLVSGYAGIGKSALVQEVYKPITRQRGYFIAGKFDQFQRNIPYASLIQAFQSLIRQLLMESEAQVTAWRKKLSTALGANGQVIIEIIPEVELIIGPQPEVPVLAPAEAQNRFNLVIQNFIRVFTHPEHLMVIFLDDLQWADSASLKLIQLLMTMPDLEYLFMIGSYRDNEVSEAHPLILTLNEIRQAGTIVNHISLAPLNLSHVTELISDTLNCELEKARPLAELVLAKTGGNPFFMNEFLKSLYTEELVRFIPSTNGHGNGTGWQWDLAQVQARGITDNVVELMAGNLQRLDEETQQALKLAACIGNQFDLQTLAIVCEKSAKETAIDLQEAVAKGLILPLGEAHKLVEFDMPELTDDLSVEYKFAHDRIQQAGYSLIPAERKQAAHRQVGQLLQRNTPPDQQDENIFNIVNQLNLGLELIEHQTERDELAELNLVAGKKAKASAAYTPALSYLQLGLELLASPDVGAEEDSWERQYALTLALYEEAAEAAYLSTNFAETERLVDTVLNHAETVLDKVKVYEVKIQLYIAQNKLSEAIETGLQILALLGIEFPAVPGDADVKRGLEETRLLLAEKPIEDLINLPAMTDPYILPAMRVLLGISALAFFTAPELSPLITFKMVSLSVTYGNAPGSAFGYGSYGIMLAGIARDIDTAYQFGRLALTLSERLKASEFKARTLVIVNGLVRHWKEHIREILSPSLDAYQIGLEMGDLQYAAFAIRMYCSRAYLVGEELSQLEQDIEKYSKAIEQLGQKTALQGNEIMQQAILNLRGQSENPGQLKGKYYDEEKMLPLHLEANDRAATFALYFHKLILSYLFQNYSQALESATMAEKDVDTAVGTPFVPIFHFYDSLARLATTQGTEQADILEKVTANQEKMKSWAEHAPMNYQHKFYLVEAERARVLGNDKDAREYYYQAITLAQENRYPREEALAYELAGQYYLSRGQRSFAHHHLREAYYAYQRWGAIGKMNQLEARYPEVFTQVNLSSMASGLTSTTTNVVVEGRISSSFDLTSVLKASQALSGEIVLGKLLTTLMKIVIENAGAQHGYLILAGQDQWVVEAEGEIGNDNIAVLQSIPVEEHSLPMSILNYVARTHENVVLNDATHQGAFTSASYIVAKQPKSVLCAPLLHQGKLTGMLYLENNLTTGAFTPDRLAVLNLLSSQVAISIENATLYTDLEANEKKYRTLFEDSKDTIFITDPDGRILDMNPTGLNLFGYSRQEMVGVKAVDFYPNPDDQLRLLQEIQERGSVRDFEVKLHKKDGTQMDCLVTATIWRANDGAILGYQGIIRDITHRKRAERERLQLSAIQRELTLAQEIQRSLLPAAKPIWSGPDALCYSTPAREVGGDFFAYHEFDDDRFGIAVGDVSGKGPPAALLMAVSLASFHAIVEQRLSPKELLTQLDRTLVPYTSKTHQNCALVYAELTLVSGQDQGGIMRVANAGCVTPIIRRVNGSVEWVEVGGLPLGVGLSVEFGYQESSLILSKGDIVILISDGIVEANNADGELFGFDRFEKAVAEAPNTSAKVMRDGLQAKVAAFVGETEHNDDLTMVVLQV